MEGFPSDDRRHDDDASDPKHGSIVSGGHSKTGSEIANFLGIPFPLRMSNLRRVAKQHGFDPDELWPWYMQTDTIQYDEEGDLDDIEGSHEVDDESQPVKLPSEPLAPSAEWPNPQRKQ